MSLAVLIYDFYSELFLILYKFLLKNIFILIINFFIIKGLKNHNIIKKNLNKFKKY